MRSKRASSHLASEQALKAADRNFATDNGTAESAVSLMAPHDDSKSHADGSMPSPSKKQPPSNLRVLQSTLKNKRRSEARPNAADR